jgi:TRAP-type C4-dicarboxylate transport system substrate-binding protein
LIEKLQDGVVDAKENPMSTQLEITAIRKAKEICVTKQLPDYEILTDNKSAAEQCGIP